VRILERIEQIYAIGDRIGYSPEEDAAHELAAGWMRERASTSRSTPLGT